jgi:DNA-directed RNA polymerase subunit RPC12/RpoP
MKGIANITNANPIENSQGLQLYEKISRGYICDECKKFYGGQSKDIRGDETFCYDCAVKLGMRKPKETNLRELYFEYYRKKGLNDDLINILWDNKKGTDDIPLISQKNKRNFTISEKDKIRMGRIATIQNELIRVGYNRSDAMKIAHKRYREENN